MSARQYIPILYPEARLCVNELEACQLLGLLAGRTERAAKQAFKAFRDRHGIPTQPGFIFAVRHIEAALEKEMMK